MTNTVTRNFPLIYAYRFLSEFWVIAPILIPYYHHAGLPPSAIFIIQAVYALSILLLEIPSGYMADVIGRKKTLLVGAAILPLGLIVYILSSSVFGFMLAEFLIAVANSMRSGCDSALIFDTLKQLDRDGHYSRIEGRAMLFSRLGTSLSSVLGGITAALFLKLPFYINLTTSCAMIPLAMLLKEPIRRKLESGHPMADIWRISGNSLKDKKLRPLLLLIGIMSGAGIVGVWSYFMYYAAIGIPIAWFGIIFAVYQLSGALGSQVSFKIEQKIGQQPLFLSFLLVGLGFIALGLGRSPLLIAVICANGFIWNYALPAIYAAINRQTASDIRATVLSTANMGGSCFFVIVGPLFGQVVDRIGLGKTYLGFGVFFMIVCSLILTAQFRSQSKTN